MGVIINYDDIPRSWRFCFCEGCPKHEDCLRYQSTQCIPDNLTWGPAVYPTSFRHGDCPHFKQIRVIHAAYGFGDVAECDEKIDSFSELPQKAEKILG